MLATALDRCKLTCRTDRKSGEAIALKVVDLDSRCGHA